MNQLHQPAALLEEALDYREQQNQKDYVNFWFTVKTNKDRKFITRNGKYPEDSSRILTNFYIVFRIYLENIFKTKITKNRDVITYNFTFFGDSCFNNEAFHLIEFAQATNFNLSRNDNAQIIIPHRKYGKRPRSRSSNYELRFREKNSLYVRDVDVLMDDLTQHLVSNIDSNIEGICSDFLFNNKIYKLFNFEQFSNNETKTKIVSAQSSSSDSTTTSREAEELYSLPSTRSRMPDPIVIERIQAYHSNFSNIRSTLGDGSYYQYVLAFYQTEHGVEPEINFIDFIELIRTN